MSDQQMPLMSHLEALRKHLMVVASAWVVGFMACYSVAEKLFTYISEPVRAALPDGTKLVFINATEPFFTYLKVAALAGFLITLPITLWQLWSFIAPALYKSEKKMAFPFVFASCCCFGIGAYFGFFFVFPMIFSFLISYGMASGDMNPMLSVGSYLTLAIRLLFAFGLVFELPIVIFFLARLGVVDHTWLAKNRKFALLIAFVTGAILTPPDVFSQASIAVPFVILYEVGIVVARMFGKKRDQEEPEETEASTE